MLRRIALIGFDHIRAKDPPISLGIASISATLRARSIEHHVFTNNVSTSWGGHDTEALVESILQAGCTDALFGAFVWNEPYVQDAMAELRKRRSSAGLRIGVGGPQVSYAEKGTLEAYYPLADYFVRGYAEEAVTRLAQTAPSDPIHAIPGVHVAGRPDLGLQARCSLQEAPSPFLDGTIPVQGFLRWESQRGCPYQCSFCQHREPGVNTRVHKAGQDRIEAELALFRSSGVSDLAVLDPTFNTSQAHAAFVLSRLPKDARVSLQVRPERLSSAFLDAVADSPARVTLELGIQTTVPGELELIDRVKGADPYAIVAKLEEKLAMVRERGVSHEVSLIYALPRQTVDSFARSIEWCQRRVGKDARIKAFPLMLLRGTPLHARRRQLGLVEGLLPTEYAIENRLQTFIPHVVETPTMTREDWVKMWRMASGL